MQLSHCGHSCKAQHFAIFDDRCAGQTGMMRLQRRSRPRHTAHTHGFCGSAAQIPQTGRSRHAKSTESKPAVRCARVQCLTSGQSRLLHTRLLLTQKHFAPAACLSLRCSALSPKPSLKLAMRRRIQNAPSLHAVRTGMERTKQSLPSLAQVSDFSRRLVFQNCLHICV